MDSTTSNTPRRVAPGLLKNGGWHNCGSFYRIEDEKVEDGVVVAQLLADFLDADKDGDEVAYEIRRANGTQSRYAHLQSARRAWRRITA